jgi:hypothetical protein
LNKKSAQKQKANTTTASRKPLFHKNQDSKNQTQIKISK